MLLHAAKYQSHFGGLWTDMANAHQEVKARLEKKLISTKEAELLDFWIDKGYVIIENAVSHDIVDGILSDMERAWETLDSRIKVERPNEAGSLDKTKRYEPGQKIVDVYAVFPTVREAIFSESIRRFLNIIFEQDILAFQSLYFERGSQQPLHQDPAYVKLSSPMKMAAAWIALENIEVNSGELIYYEGSHKIEEFLFDNIYKHWNGVNEDAHKEFLDSLHIKCKALNLPLKKFQPKKGDVLIWAADLVHGGSKIAHANSNITRRSLVTHYCPYDVNPSYFMHQPKNYQVKVNFRDDCYYSSAHYLLYQDMPEQAQQNIIQDSFQPELPKSEDVKLIEQIKKFVHHTKKIISLKD